MTTQKSTQLTSLKRTELLSELDWIDESLMSDLRQFCTENKAVLIHESTKLYIEIDVELAENAHTKAIPFLHRTVPFYGLTSALDRIINPPKNRNQLTATYDGGKTVHHKNPMTGRWSS